MILSIDIGTDHNQGALGELPKDVVPGSDGAGIVKEVGSKVKDLKVGEHVVTHLAPTEDDNALPPSMAEISAGLGHGINGTLQEYGHFHQTALIKAPHNLDFARAATLTCSGLTAWNALFGLAGREVKKGDWVLVQGTGGVSIAALQFAAAVGAHVVATTSSQEKAKRLKELGAEHVVNYRTTPGWGVEARKLVPENAGFDLIVDVGGDSTLNESLKAVRTDGVVAATGLLGADEPVPMLSAIFHVCIVRGVLLGTRKQFKDMVSFIEEKEVQPVLDDVVFGLEEVRDAYERMVKQEHFSKVVIKMGR